MKTKNIIIGLLTTFAFISLNVSAVNSDINKNKKGLDFCLVGKELKEAGRPFENWMIELKEFNNFAWSYSDEEVQIENWMTKEFHNNTEYKNFTDQDITLEEWMTNSVNFNGVEISADIDQAIEPWMYEIM